ncbi:MAG: alpha/beta hydrolase [Candidatus Cryptobacteroides sp.]
MKRFLVLIIAGLFSFANLEAGTYKTVKDILYKADNDEYSEKMCRLDLAYEEGGQNRPVIIWFHGGGLTSGSRNVPQTLMRDGAVIVGVGYRFVSEVELSEVVDDAAASVKWVLDNIEQYGGDISKIYLAGHSAGGYLVDMLGLDKHYLAKYGIDADSMAAIVPYSGQVITHFAQRKKSGIPELTPVIDNFAPLYHVRGDSAPFLIISGDREMELFGRYEETAYFARMLRLNGHRDVTFFELEGFDHGDMVEPGHLILLKYIARGKK